MSQLRSDYADLRASHRAGLLCLRRLLPADGSADGLMDTVEKATEKLYDDMDAVLAFFTEPEPQSLRADAPRQSDIAPVPPPTAKPGRVFTLIEGGAA